MSSDFILSVDKPLRILFVEDNELNIFYISKVVAGLQDKIEVVENGKLAVDKAESSLYDLIFMDIQLPVMNGLEAVKLIRKLPAPNGTVPIIGMTHAEIEDPSRFNKNSGMNDFLDKTFTLEDLRKMARKFVKKEIIGTEESIRISFADDSPIARVKNPETRNRMIQVFIDQLKEFYQKMDSSLEKADWDQINFLIHKMKSSAEVMGIHAVQVVLDVMENNSFNKQLNELNKNYVELKQLLKGFSSSSL